MKLSPLKVFIGYDHVESVSWHVAASSIMRYASVPVSISPIDSRLLKSVYQRERDPRQSNDFSFTRFLVPYLSGYQGWSLFVDCDVLLRADIASLFKMTDDHYSVMVCKHDYVPKDTIKYLGNRQYRYPCKNWSSVMLMNNARCTKLTPEYVQRATGANLHQFQWLYPEQVGSLPIEWNWLVREYDDNPKAKLFHYTVGGPWFEEYRYCDQSDAWREELGYMLNPMEGYMISPDQSATGDGAMHDGASEAKESSACRFCGKKMSRGITMHERYCPQRE